MTDAYWLETLGCPKNQVDSAKLSGTLEAGGYIPARSPGEADLVVVNTCAFIEAARQESIDTILSLAAERRPHARIVVTGCLAERYGSELRRHLPEVDLVAGFGAPVTLRSKAPSFDLLNLPRPKVTAHWAYVKVAEGCDRHCGFCAIPSFRGAQRSRSADDIVTEVADLGDDVREVVLVAQDLASWSLDRLSPRRGIERPIVGLIGELSKMVERVRLLYLYPSSLDDSLIAAIADTDVHYFDLSLQHASRRLLRSMRRWGESDKFLERIRAIRALCPEAALRSSFILGYPGETEEDHDLLLEFIEEAQLDWGGFFTFSEEEGTYASSLSDEYRVPAELALERLRECAELQDSITDRRRAALIGSEIGVLVDEVGVGRSHREAPEIDGVVHVDKSLAPGEIHQVIVADSCGPDLWATLPHENNVARETAAS